MTAPTVWDQPGVVWDQPGGLWDAAGQPTPDRPRRVTHVAAESRRTVVTARRRETA